jgi:hypothetical protein
MTGSAIGQGRDVAMDEDSQSRKSASRVAGCSQQDRYGCNHDAAQQQPSKQESSIPPLCRQIEGPHLRQRDWTLRR